MKSNSPPVVCPPITLADAAFVSLGETHTGLLDLGERRQDERADGAKRRPAVLPRLCCNNSNEVDLSSVDLQGPGRQEFEENLNSLAGRRCTTTMGGQVWRMPTVYHARLAFGVRENIEWMVNRNGIERIGFLTLTFPKHITDGRKASKKYNSLATGVLRERYSEIIKVNERHQNGRIHYHLVVVLPEDIRTGFKFAEANNKKLPSRIRYRSACPFLKREWAWLRSILPKYGFGRHELKPIRTTAKGIAEYVGGYIAKNIMFREERDKGLRLVSYSVKARKVSGPFTFAFGGMMKWRRCLAKWAATRGMTDYSQLRQRCGPKWAWHNRESIMSIEDAPNSLHVAVPAPGGRDYLMEAASGVQEGFKAPQEIRWTAVMMRQALEGLTCRDSVSVPGPGLGLKAILVSHLEALWR